MILFYINTKGTVHERIVKLKCIKIENFFIVKHSVNRMKRQATACEKTFAKYICDKELVFKICKLEIIPDWKSPGKGLLFCHLVGISRITPVWVTLVLFCCPLMCRL